MESRDEGEMNSQHQVWVAGALSLCCTGLGHLYAGRLKRGLVLFLVSLLILPFAALAAGILTSTAALVGLVVSFLGLLALWLFAVIDACRITARETGTDRHDYQQPVIYALFIAAGIGSPALSTLYIRQNLLEAFYLPSESMAPTLRKGDRILANKMPGRINQLNRQDLVVFRPPDHRDQNYVKRLVGLPGDRIDVSGETVTVPEGTCFVLGDNRENSRDSRHFGPVPLGDVIGVAEYVYLPGDTWSRFGALR
jgi:signal peptidase I